MSISQVSVRVGEWDVIADYQWSKSRWESIGYSLSRSMPVEPSVGNQSMDGRRVESDTTIQTTNPPDVPRNQNPPTSPPPGLGSGSASSGFTYGGWEYTYTYTWGVDENGVLGWHLTSVTMKRVTSPKPPFEQER